jgi:plasmid stabilization system protein ParE
VSRVEIAPEVGGDFDRILDHLALHQVADAAARIREIIAAFDVLASNPQIGRPTASDMRELIIGRGSRGYVALYRYVAEIDTVFVLALRSQREAGYKRP